MRIITLVLFIAFISSCNEQSNTSRKYRAAEEYVKEKDGEPKIIRTQDTIRRDNMEASRCNDNVASVLDGIAGVIQYSASSGIAYVSGQKLAVVPVPWPGSCQCGAAKKPVKHKRTARL